MHTSRLGRCRIDIPVCDDGAVEVLSGVFGFHRIAVRDCVERNHVSQVHIYPDHVFTVLHAPQVGKRGHVHYVELDQFIGRNYLVTVHGPLNPTVNPQVAFLDTGAVLRRIEKKNLHICSPYELSHWIVSALIRRESELVASLAKESEQLEQRVMLGEDLEDPEVGEAADGGAGRPAPDELQVDEQRGIERPHDDSADVHVFGDPEDPRGDDGPRCDGPHDRLGTVDEVRLDDDLPRLRSPRQQVVHDALPDAREGGPREHHHGLAAEPRHGDLRPIGERVSLR